MSDRFDDNNLNRTRRRKCFYDFSKDYPGTRYDKNKRSSTTDELDGKRFIIRKVLISLLIIFCFLLAYFVVYTVIGISHEKIAKSDNLAATTVEETYTVSDEDIINMIKERSSQSQQTHKAPETTEETQTVSDSGNNE